MNESKSMGIPGFTAEHALEHGASARHGGLARDGAAGGAVQPAGCITRNGTTQCCELTSLGDFCWSLRHVTHLPE
jgi:hypothetical protein